jgi:3',5'-cyclic AMP phosphodiesterase CpdA
MADHATFLHVTDAHVSASGVSFERDDHKVDVPEIPSGAREQALELLFRRLAERLGREGRTLDGVLFSGDAQSRGEAGGHELVLVAMNHDADAAAVQERANLL